MEQTNYEKLRTRINELLPERLQLEFGCDVRLKIDGDILSAVHWNTNCRQCQAHVADVLNQIKRKPLLSV
jgi:hypothetical protein